MRIDPMHPYLQEGRAMHSSERVWRDDFASVRVLFPVLPARRLFRLFQGGPGGWICPAGRTTISGLASQGLEGRRP